MVFVKKLLFAPLFLLFLNLAVYQIIPFLTNKELLFSLDPSLLINFIGISLSIIFASVFFIIFATLASDWRIILALSIVAILPQALLIPLPLGVLSGVWTAILLFFSYFLFNNSLKTYINFKPSELMSPSIKNLISLITLTLCLTFFISMSNIIKQEGFQIPQSLVEYASKFSPEQSLDTSSLDPETAKALSLSASDLKTDNKVVQATIKKQFQDIINPYISYIPAILAVLLFLTLKSIESLFSALISPTLYLVFSILEKTGFIKFTTEMREVKKLVV